MIKDLVVVTTGSFLAGSSNKVYDKTTDKIVYLMNVEKTKFRNPVSPNQKIYSDVLALRSKGRVWRFEGKIHCDNKKIICEATWSAMIMDRNNV